ncbi:hypothetical protein ONE63_001066 [Megalurothrips usitatus]|uniref:Uncharacterized protein n=1 Tax=Megalurothrips usitatus TaxID=439358 RepID=A0AAV7XH93_9NEOP|nr:hypothetical protein ONE63_001066 [Megalurothrips usitatus]
MVPARSCAAVRGLLSLRLVCRRWSRAVLSPAVWRHRSLAVGGDREQRAAVAALRLVPALRSLQMTIATAAEHGGSCLRALARSRCQVNAIKIFSEVSGHSGILIFLIIVWIF